MTPNRRVKVTFGAIIALISLAACSPSAGSGGGLMPEHTEFAKVAAGANSSLGSAPSVASPAAGSADASADGVSGTDSATTASAILTDDSKILTARLSVAVARARDVGGTADRADGIAESVGGEVDSDDRTSGKYAQAELVLRVPPHSLPSVLQKLAALGKEQSRDLSTTDVTERVADVSSRVASAQATISRLRAIYASATKISDVLAIEDDLSSREADLEALQAQQRALSRQTSMATITLSLHTGVQTAAPTKHHGRGGFLGGLDRGWHTFTSAASGLATGLGAALPFLALLLVLGLAGRFVWGRRSTQRPAASDPSA